MGDDSEVTSSSTTTSGGHHHHSQIIIADVIVNQTHNTDSDVGSGGGDVDLDLWDLDLNSVYGDGGSVPGNVSNGNSVPAAKRTVMRNNSLAVSSFSDSSSGRRFRNTA